jgi:hypothetical protein
MPKRSGSSRRNTPSTSDGTQSFKLDLSVLDDDSGGWDARRPVGKGNPPRKTSWKKGDPSPNPRGAPPRGNVGPYSKKLHQKVGKGATTIKEALDNKLLALTAKGDVRANKLYHRRLEREEQIEAIRTAYQSYQHQQAEAAQRRPDHLQFTDFVTLVLKTIEAAQPGLLDCLEQLQSLGVIEMRDGQYQIVKALDRCL